jgi:hypothetical protein
MTEDTSFGQNRIARVSVISNDSIVVQQKPVTLTASVENKLDELVTGTLIWHVQSVFFDSPPPIEQPISLNGRQSISCEHTLSMPCPGFADIECRFETPKSKNPITAKYRIGSDVEDISSPLTRQVDFFDFWEQSLAELAEVPPAFQMTTQPNKARPKVQLHEVSMESFGDVSVRGWLETPNKAGVFPAVLRLPGYGQAMKPVGDQENLIVFSFNPRGHGNSQDDIPGTPQDYWVRGLDDRDTYFIAVLTLTVFEPSISSVLLITLTKNGLQYGEPAKVEALHSQRHRLITESISALQTYPFSAIGQITSSSRSGTKWING